MNNNSNSEENNELTIIETFVGAGGSHLGFKNAGYKSLLVNDIDKDTIETLLLNKVISKDQYLLCPIEDITQEILLSKIKNKKVDVLFGGIVCKGFSLAGVRNPFDPRNECVLLSYRDPDVGTTSIDPIDIDEFRQKVRKIVDERLLELGLVGKISKVDNHE